MDTSGPLVVIPCLNEERHLAALLAQLLRDGPSDILIVVADGGSKDATAEIARGFAAEHPQVRLLSNPKRVQSAAVNLAALRFGHGRRWMVRVDAHCGYPDHYVAGLVEAAERTGAGEVVAPMVTRAEPGECFQAAVAAAQNSKLGTGGSAHRHVGVGQFVDHGHHALFDLAAFMAAGGYDEGFSHNEDAELDARLTRAGGKIWIEPSLALVYHPRKTVGSLFRQYLKYGEGRARNLQRHKAKMKLRQIAPLAVAPAVGLAIAGVAGLVIVGGWAVLLAVPALAWAFGACLFGVVLGAKARRSCVAFSGPAAMVMHLSWSLGFWRQVLLQRRPGPEPRPFEPSAVI